MKQTGKKRLWLKVVIVFLILAVTVGGITAWQVYRAIYRPQNILKGKSTEYFYVRTGWKAEDVIHALHEKGYIKDKNIFEWLADKKNYKNNVHPGKYLLKKEMSNNEIVNMLRSGKQVPVDLLIENLHSLKQLAGRVGHNLETDSAKVYELLKDEAFLKKYGFKSQTVISMFIANKYRFEWNTSAEQFFERMHQEYEKFWSDTRKGKLKRMGFSKIQAITLASIVEMESRKRDEQPVVAGVYMNRLRKDMPLQADPTVIFANGDWSIKRVLKKHLEIDSPYNTYKYAGLPPGPICMPSRTAIDAVLTYEKHSYIYFCAKEDFSGYHNFAETYNQHLANARKYQNVLNRNNIK